MVTVEENFNGGSGYAFSGCDQEVSQPGGGSSVTTFSAYLGNGCPAVQQDAQVFIARTQACFSL